MFELYKDKSKKFRFRLKAKNGEIICASQSYTTKSACTKGAKSLILNSKKKKSFKVLKYKIKYDLKDLVKDMMDSDIEQAKKNI